tara:strand:- start:1987 stop:2394 length:408 start_codon:yes stop_codon:yes gene_type:complete
MSDDIKKFEAFQGLVARHYVPTFVEKLASHGMVFETEEELAHALQLNGKFAAVISDGVSLDTLVDAISTRLSTTNVKAAAAGHVNSVDLGSINFAFDDIMKEAGFALDDSMQAKQASAVGVKSEDRDAVSTLFSN